MAISTLYKQAGGQNSDFFLKKIHIELDFLLVIVVIRQNAISYSFDFFDIFFVQLTSDLSLARKAPLNFLRGVLWDEAKAKEVVFDMVARGAPKELY